MDNIKYVAPHMRVWSGYAVTLAHNGERNDASLTLMIAPQVGVEAEVLYIESNGDPTAIGWRNPEDGVVTVWRNVDIEAWLETDDAAWVRLGLADIGWDGETWD